MSGWLKSIFPLASRLSTYGRDDFVGDLIAGVIVAIMLVPQGMAYAMLAGLPPQTGLYASTIPLFLYGIFGSSNTLAVGPVAMVSLLVVSGVGELATPGSAEFIGYGLTLALLVGLMQIGMAVMRMGFLVNFISHPVLAGFTSAAAIVIGFSQVKHLLGVKVETGEYPFQLIAGTVAAAGGFNPATLAIGAGSVAALLAIAKGGAALLERLGIGKAIATALSRTGPLIVVASTAALAGILGLDGEAGVSVVGTIPAGLPGLTFPSLNLESLRGLLPLALVITLVGYLESISVAKALAARRREKVDANRELFALGAADIGASLTGGYPVTGGFSRSLVNFTAGARTPVATLVTAVLVAISVTFLTPLFHFIPKAALAAIILVAVAGLVDIRTPVRLWRYSRADATALVITFAAVLGLGIESGILVGVVSTGIMLMWRTSRPHIAEVGRVGTSEHFRNVNRHDVTRTPGLLAFRFDESLSFANAPFLEHWIQERVADRHDIHSVLMIGSGINDIDSSGLEMLESLIRELKTAGVALYFAEFKGPVTDRLIAAGFDPEFLQHHIFLSTHVAVETIADRPLGATRISPVAARP